MHLSKMALIWSVAPSASEMVWGTETDEMLDGDVCDDDEMDGAGEFFEVGGDSVVWAIFLFNSFKKSLNSVL